MIPKRRRAKRDKLCLPSLPRFVVLVGDIVSGFEAYGPFDSGSEAITWKSAKGRREQTHGQWFVMRLREPD